MGKEESDAEVAFKGEVNNSDYSEPPPLLQSILLIVNIVLITAILIVSSLWASVRDNPDMEMVPAPNKDRSICVPSEVPGGQCIKTKPEEYILEQIEKNIRKSHMQYMAEKLNYANVVCRKSSPSVFLFKGISGTDSITGNLLWKQNNNDNTNQKDSIKYNIASGLVDVIKGGTFFIYSQITEMAENMHNGTNFDISVISEGKTEKVLESVSGSCNMVSALSKRSHYVGSAIYLKTGDSLFAKHSHPSKILNFDSFLGIRELKLLSSGEG